MVSDSLFVTNHHRDSLNCIISVLFVMHTLTLNINFLFIQIKVCLGVCSQKTIPLSPSHLDFHLFKRLSPPSHECSWLEIFHTRPPDSPLQKASCTTKASITDVLLICIMLKTVKWMELWKIDSINTKFGIRLWGMKQQNFNKISQIGQKTWPPRTDVFLQRPGLRLLPHPLSYHHKIWWVGSH